MEFACETGVTPKTIWQLGDWTVPQEELMIAQHTQSR